MIVKARIDFSAINFAAEKISRSAHAAYWLSNVGSEAGASFDLQEQDILAGFRDIASALGYRVEKIETAEPDPASQEENRRLRGLIRWAHDTLYEINQYNYDHDEVCKLNDASVEVILGLAPELGETHGKTDEWWAGRVSPITSEEPIHNQAAE